MKLTNQFNQIFLFCYYHLIVHVHLMCLHESVSTNHRITFNNVKRLLKLLYSKMRCDLVCCLCWNITKIENELFIENGNASNEIPERTMKYLKAMRLTNAKCELNRSNPQKK